MTNETTIRKIVDNILLNACSVNSSGLYNGKAGMALALFEAARYLQDDYIEEQAFDLLQEALITKTEDISFENGLSGIGYVLLYLIQEQFINGNYEELFGQNHLKIETKLETVVKQRNLDLATSFLTTVYYLDRFDKTIKQSKKRRITRLFKLSSGFLKNNLKEILQGIYTLPKIHIIRLFEIYLRVADNCNLNPEIEVLELYSNLFNKNKFTYNGIIGYYFCKIGEQTNNETFLYIGRKNKELAVQGICPQTLSLSQKINQLYWMRQSYDFYNQTINFIEQDIFHQDDEDKLEKELLKGIPRMALIAGYESGLSRFLLYYIYATKNIGSNYELLVL